MRNWLPNLFILSLCSLAFWLHKEELSSFKISFSWYYIVGIAFIFSSTVIGGLNWFLLLKNLYPSLKLVKTKAIQNHLRSWIFRYIPGIGYFGYKLVTAKSQGLSKSLISAAIMYEQVLIQLSSYVIGIGFLIVGFFGTLPTLRLVSFLMLVLLIWIIFLHRMETILHLFAKKIPKLEVLKNYKLTTSQMITLVFKFSYARILISLGVILCSTPNMKLTFSSTLLIAGAYLIASAVGILAVFAPSGIGVREVVFITIGSFGGLPTTDLLFLSILLRAATTIADLILGILIMLFRFSPQIKLN